jgi:hypothetical protein
LSDAARLGFAVDLVAPWYFNFYAGWFSDLLVREKIAYVCADENLVSDPIGEVIRICEHFQLTVNRPAIEAVVGRDNALSEAHRATLARMRGYYSHIDMSSIDFPN